MRNKIEQERRPSAYLLQHVAREGTDDEDVKVLGVYSSQSRAEAAITRFVKLPGFKRYRKSFYIDRYALDEDEWREGFVTRRSAPKVMSKSKPGVRK